MHRLSMAVTAALLLSHPALLLAQAGDPTELDEIVVTGTRTDIALADSLVPMQVIDREEIDRAQARSLGELLRGRAGISLSNQGGAGKITTLSIRGTEADHVLVLVDGVRMGSATAGLPALQDLPIDLIDRIEIVRGPRSSLWGSEAIGGVIQVFTRRDRGRIRPRLRIGAGSHGTHEASAGIGGGDARGWFGADVAYAHTDGFNACRGRGPDPADPFDWGAGCFADEPDDDGYRNASASVRGGFKLTGSLTLEANALRADASSQFDGSFANRSDTVQQVIGARLRYAPGSRVGVLFSVGRNDDVSDDYLGAAWQGDFRTRRNLASLQADVTLSHGHLLTAGLDWQDDAVESSTLFDVTRRDNLAGFVEYQGRAGHHQWQASLRGDDNAQFGHHATGSLGYGRGFDNGLTLTATWSTGFKAPSFNDLYYPFFGNPALAPEESDSIDVGIARQAGAWRWSFNAYRNAIDQLIAYDASIFLPNNIDKARIRGAEFTLATTFSGFDLSAQLSHSDPRNRSQGPDRGKQLARRARNSMRIDLDRAFGSLRAGVTLNAASGRYDDLANRVRLGGHATLDLRLERALSRAWTLQAKLDNALDRRYETVAWYHQPGRAFGLSLRYQAPD